MKPAIALIPVHLASGVVPLLSPDGFLAYTKYLPFTLPVMEHSHARAALPQLYSDQFGWKQIDVFLCKGALFGALSQFWPKVKRWR